jgi:hypothetical protein
MKKIEMIARVKILIEVSDNSQKFLPHYEINRPWVSGVCKYARVGFPSIKTNTHVYKYINVHL